ncbi:Sir2 family NAD-dependent protein deacetylase [uncultured Nevskia sp.]|uniref:SIR2 family NAD-dependent protein deacylase n=1 Tax=uncultured Nevskia sp. TaxID=228950 RepID=UPI0025D1DDEE|nr:Sir2 family NAD-dependent protein deacetylase [uncultured Nevskia sp.]
MFATALSHWRDFRNIVLFTGAGLSAESGVPTYRGAGGIWREYNYQDYACQRAFERDPVQVLDFHELRRTQVLSCAPHAGHAHIRAMQAEHPGIQVITQNIDGLLQRAGVAVAAELHGSLWRLRCPVHGVREDLAVGTFAHRQCPDCPPDRSAGRVPWLRPDITWFEDAVNEAVFEHAAMLVDDAELFVGIGTSGAVWPAAGFAERARRHGARMVEINPEDNEASALYGEHVRLPASKALPETFPISG